MSTVVAHANRGSVPIGTSLRWGTHDPFSSGKRKSYRRVVAAIERAGTFLDGIQQLPDDRADLVTSMARVTRTVSNPKQKIRTLRRN
jgi:hypothetical protein